MNTSERTSKYPIHPLILNRWSPRAMTGESIPEEVLMSLFEAARWAPSSSNNQPWRFVYAKRDTKHFETLFQLLIEFNQQWCKNAAVLGVIIGSKNFEKTGKPSRTYAMDTGAAWENLALEAWNQGLFAHGMEGFDYEMATKVLEVPEEFEVLAMFAVGKRAPKETLPEKLKEREFPSSRKEIAQFAFEGKFRK
jgi:nitroreductase